MDRTYVTALTAGRHDPSVGTIFLMAPILGVTPLCFFKRIAREREGSQSEP
jgi:hypothetical protein